MSVAKAQLTNQTEHTVRDSPFEALIALSDKLRNTNSAALSLTDVIGVAELLTNSLQPLLRRIDSTLHKELRGILNRIESLRSDIAKVRADDISNNRIPQMGKELSAIVKSTESATNTIMESAEKVLEADAKAEDYAEIVSDNMMAIFEACSFQDLTGQRVNKIVETIEIIEKRVNLLCEMLDMHAIDMPDADDDEMAAREQRKKDLILHGPADDSEGVKQADIDKLF